MATSGHTVTWAEELRSAWHRWERSPAAYDRADAMEHAAQRAAAELDTTATRLRIHLAARRHVGYSIDEIVENLAHEHEIGAAA